jgi:hypothetical protein
MTETTAHYFRAMLKGELRAFHPFTFFVETQEAETVGDGWKVILYTTDTIPDTIAETVNEFSKTYKLRYLIGQGKIFNHLSTTYTFSK